MPFRKEGQNLVHPCRFLKAWSGCSNCTSRRDVRRGAISQRHPHSGATSFQGSSQNVSIVGDRNYARPASSGTAPFPVHFVPRSRRLPVSIQGFLSSRFRRRLIRPLSWRSRRAPSRPQLTGRRADMYGRAVAAAIKAARAFGRARLGRETVAHGQGFAR